MIRVRRILCAAVVAASVACNCTPADARQLPVLNVAAPTARLLSGSDIAAFGVKPARAFLHDANRAVKAIGVPDQSLPAGTVAMKAGTVQAFGADYINVPVEIYVDGRLARTVMTGYRVTAYVERPVANHAIAAGDVLAESDFTVKRVADSNGSHASLAALVGRTAKSAIAAGTSPEVWQTQTVDVVHPGEQVVLIVRDGNVALSADVIARSAGGIGDTVSVFDEHANRTTNAVVVAPGKVELRLQEVGT